MTAEEHASELKAPDDPTQGAVVPDATRSEGDLQDEAKTTVFPPAQPAPAPEAPFPSSPAGADAAADREKDSFAQRPELFVGGAFAGAFLVAQILKRFGGDGR
ncbi:MAG: hypothetical protein NVSMB25_16530 [Thermoleophilaceae bacterium]